MSSKGAEWSYKAICPRCGHEDEPDRDHWQDTDCEVVTCPGCEKNYERHVSVEVMFSCDPTDEEADE